MSLRYPDFLCIGAQKAGTTWLHRVLGEHPDLWLPPLKEVHYFDVLHLGYDKDPETGLTAIDRNRIEKARRIVEGTAKKKRIPPERQRVIDVVRLIGTRTLTDEWYGRIFAAAPETAQCGEITPEYALLPDEGVAHILRLSPGARFIFVLRDPIERGWSDLRMLRARRSAKPFSELGRIRNKDFIARADYFATIERFRRLAGDGNLLVLYFDEIAEDPRALLHKACVFLGVDFARANVANLDEPVHQGEQTPMPPDIREALKASLKPAYDRLRALDSPVVEGWYRRHYA
jgi:hypothetical protein